MSDAIVSAGAARGRRTTLGATLARVRLDALLVGRAPYIVPPLVLGAVVLLTLITPDDARLATASIEAIVPLVAGLVTASLLATERSLELQLSTPRGFRPAALRRLGLVFGYAAAFSMAGWLAFSALGLTRGWQPPVGPLAAQLIWLPSLAAFTVGGALVGVALRSRTGAASAVALFWLAGLFFKDVFETTAPLRSVFPFLTTFEPAAADWLATRLAMLGIAGAAALVLAVWLGAGEWLLGGEDR